MARSEKLDLLDEVLQKPSCATAANPSAGAFFSVNKGSLYTFLLLEIHCLDLLTLHPCCYSVSLPSSDSSLKWSQLFNEKCEDSKWSIFYSHSVVEFPKTHQECSVNIRSELVLKYVWACVRITRTLT